MHILLAENEPSLARYLCGALEGEHIAVDVASSGEQARRMAQTRRPDVALLDLNEPPLDSLALLEELRALEQDLPVVVLTESNQAEERVRCFKSGADDSLAKPFAFAELLARLRAVDRRCRQRAAVRLTAGDLELDLVARRAERGGRPIDLSPKEFALLELLMRQAGSVVSRGVILERVWQAPAEGMDSNLVDVYVNYLRKKVDAGFPAALIQTVRGAGYRLEPREKAQ
jgi:DNA-binding response OmpR family regulator